MKHTFIIVGPSGSGKTSLGKLLESEGYTKLITTTNRPIRPGEIDGVDYYFITETYTENLKRFGIEHNYISVTNYGDHFYGLRADEFMRKYTPEHKYIILDYKGALEYEENFEDCIIVYMDVDESTVKKRMEARGDTPEDINKRLGTYAQETKQMSELKQEGRAIVLDANESIEHLLELL